MISKVYSAAVIGIVARPVEIEADIAAGIPCFELTGNLSGTVREAKERVRIALRNSNFKINPSRITINITPADMHKDGTHFDLAMAVAVLSSLGIIDDDMKGRFFVGELGLDGRVCRVKAVLPMVICARDYGYNICYVPKENEKEASVIKGIRVIGVNTLTECVMHIKGECEIAPCNGEIPRTVNAAKIDFSQIRGQKSVKRAVLIAAASMHNILLIGPPGAGKSMIASRIPTILPEPEFEDMLRITCMYSVAGMLNEGKYIINERPFRAPHHSITCSAFAGGGIVPIPGEMSLADAGVLFLDEFNLFRGEVIDSMRLPMENHFININRIHGNYKYPADFMLVAAMNPCACGFYPDRTRCKCREHEIKHYFGKINKPIMDRIDMCIRVTKSTYGEIKGDDEDNISSSEMKETVSRCFEIQKERYLNTGIRFNSRLESHQIKKYCRMSHDAEDFLHIVFDKYDLSARNYYKIIKVARTIADIDGCEIIEERHICEAIGYKLV